MTLPQGVSERRTKHGIKVLRIHYSADPERGPEWVERERARYSSEGTWQREQEIVHEAGAGDLVFGEVLSKWSQKIIINDPSFEISPYWRPIGGMDHGRTNPTGALEGVVDGDGVIILTGEYYQPGLNASQNHEQLKLLRHFCEVPAVMADPSMFYKTQQQADGGFKAVSELYGASGLNNLMPAPENNELLGMERILEHWSNLDLREPTLRIVCRQDYSRKSYGVNPYGCPNLLWELKRTRRERLTATQLMRKNPTEAIVDKDNHLRDCLKYIVCSLPRPAIKPRELLLKEAVTSPDPTIAMMQYRMAEAKLNKQEEPIIMRGRGAGA